VLPRACSAKMVARMSLIVSSIASTALVIRPATSGLVIIGMVPSSDMPVAYNRWMTRSCRSRAIRSLSSYTRSRSASARLDASSSATPAWAANEATTSAWAGGNGGAPWRRPTVSTPRTLPGAPSGNTTAGPIWLIAPRAALAARSSAAKSSDVTGWPEASTRPDRDWPAGSTRPSVAAAPSPAA
jgi:hypothetical protein